MAKAQEGRSGGADAPPSAPLSTAATVTVLATDEFHDCSSVRANSEPAVRSAQATGTRVPMDVEEAPDRTRSQSRAAEEKRKLQIEHDLKEIDNDKRRKAESDAREAADINSLMGH